MESVRSEDTHCVTAVTAVGHTIGRPCVELQTTDGKRCILVLLFAIHLAQALRGHRGGVHDISWYHSCVYANALESFESALWDASEKGDLNSVRSLMDTRSVTFMTRFALSFDYACRMSLSSACAYGHLNVVAYWLDDSSLTPRCESTIMCHTMTMWSATAGAKWVSWHRYALGSSCAWTL